MTKTRPIRFGTGGGRSSDPSKLTSAAKRAEDLGYSTFGMADHFMMPLAPLIALQAVADATTSLRLTQVMLAEGFRRPAVLAKELATLDVLSRGRLEIGLGAGWMRSEFEQAGIPFDTASVRIERLEELVVVLKGLFGDGALTHSGRHFTISGLEGTPKPAQRPHPPIMIGGGGPKILAAAARQADIVQVLPGSPGRGRSPGPSAYGAEEFMRKVELIREAAGQRFEDLELGTLLLAVTVTDDAERAVDEIMDRLVPPGSTGDSGRRDRDAILSSPVVAVGSLEQVCEKLLDTRDRFGFTYFAGPVGAAPEVLAPVIERLADY